MPGMDDRHCRILAAFVTVTVLVAKWVNVGPTT
jgi:hypothetical protein